MNELSIKDYLYRIKDNIRAVESGLREQAVFDEIENDFYQMLELIKLFMISERDSYYGYFLMNMSFRADFTSHCIAGVRLNTYPPLMESNPLLLCSRPLKEIIFIICHEIEHIILAHPSEMVKANPTNAPEVFEKFNIAADASVNDRLRFEIKKENRSFMTVPNDCILSETIGKMFKIRNVRQLENYRYYFDLIKNKNMPDNMENQSQSGGDGDDDNEENTSSSGTSENGNETNGDNIEQHPQSGDGGDNDTDENTSSSGSGDDGSEPTEDNSTGQSGNNNGDDIVTADNCGKPDDHNWQAGDDADEIKSVIKEFMNEAAEMMDDETRGLMPSYFLEQIKKINEPPKISWQKLLKKYVGTISASKRKTRTKLNRRQPERYDLSGEMNDKILKIVVAIDTSGSVDDHQVAQIFNEIFAILAKRKFRITVIECDSKIQRVYTVNSPVDVKLEVAGRGGTWFTPVIDYVSADRYFRDALLIYFTDGYGEDSIPKPLTYRNLWVITGRTEDLSLKEPYGAVISFEEGA